VTSSPHPPPVSFDTPVTPLGSGLRPPERQKGKPALDRAMLRVPRQARASSDTLSACRSREGGNPVTSSPHPPPVSFDTPATPLGSGLKPPERQMGKSLLDRAVSRTRRQARVLGEQRQPIHPCRSREGGNPVSSSPHPPPASFDTPVTPLGSGLRPPERQVGKPALNRAVLRARRHARVRSDNPSPLSFRRRVGQGMQAAPICLQNGFYLPAKTRPARGPERRSSAGAIVSNP